MDLTYIEKRARTEGAQCADQYVNARTDIIRIDADRKWARDVAAMMTRIRATRADARLTPDERNARVSAISAQYRARIDARYSAYDAAQRREYRRLQQIAQTAQNAAISAIRGLYK